jgi:hypothetical protein
LAIAAQRVLKKKRRYKFLLFFSILLSPLTKEKNHFEFVFVFYCHGRMVSCLFHLSAAGPKWTDQPRTCKRLGCPHQLTHVALSSDDTFSLSTAAGLSLSQSNRFGEMFVF